MLVEKSMKNMLQNGAIEKVSEPEEEKEKHMLNEYNMYFVIEIICHDIIIKIKTQYLLFNLRHLQ